VINEQEIILKTFQDEDELLFQQWLEKDHVYKWFCCGGSDDEQARIDGLSEKQDWLDEITQRDENPHRHQFIVLCNGTKIGYGVCLDLAGEPEYTNDQYPDLNGKLRAGEAFELGYCIGEESYLYKGIGKIIIKKLEEKCRETGASLLLADPNEKNIPSVKVLLTNGFEKNKDGDYRKHLQ